VIDDLISIVTRAVTDLARIGSPAEGDAGTILRGV
jgi:hypothetical protein